MKFLKKTEFFIEDVDLVVNIIIIVINVPVSTTLYLGRVLCHKYDISRMSLLS